jgi:ankyrin repeat protein
VAENGMMAVLEILLERDGVVIDSKDDDDDGCTPLLKVVWYSEMDVVECLLEKGANVNAQDRGGRTPLMLSVLSSILDEYNLDFEIMKLVLAQLNVDVNLTDKNGYSALSLAIRCGVSEIEELLRVHRAVGESFFFCLNHLISYSQSRVRGALASRIIKMWWYRGSFGLSFGPR